MSAAIDALRKEMTEFVLGDRSYHNQSNGLESALDVINADNQRIIALAAAIEALKEQ